MVRPPSPVRTLPGPSTTATRRALLRASEEGPLTGESATRSQLRSPGLRPTLTWEVGARGFQGRIPRGAQANRVRGEGARGRGLGREKGVRFVVESARRPTGTAWQYPPDNPGSKGEEQCPAVCAPPKSASHCATRPVHHELGRAKRWLEQVRAARAAQQDRIHINTLTWSRSAAAQNADLR